MQSAPREYPFDCALTHTYTYVYEHAHGGNLHEHACSLLINLGAREEREREKKILHDIIRIYKYSELRAYYNSFFVSNARGTTIYILILSLVLRMNIYKVCAVGYCKLL